ncbi:MAG: Trm112 family protein [Candidatus Sumerlaeaceae bacterium]
MISQDFLDILACPKCKQPLEYKPSADGKGGALLCHQCSLSYSIIDDIPNLIIEDATSIKQDT